LDLDRRIPIDKHNNRRLRPMATNDGFPPNDRFSLFLSEYAGEGEQPETGQAWDGTVISSRTLKTSMLLATAVPMVFVVLWVANPTVLVANATTSLASTFAPQDGTGAQALPSIARRAPSRDEIAAALKAAFQSQTGTGRQPAEVLLTQFQTWAAGEKTNDEVAADQIKTETRQPSADILLTQFQTWAAEEDSRTQVEPVHPAQDAGAPAVQDAQAQVRPTQKHRQVRPVQNARAEIRPVQEARAQLRREQNARVQDRTAQDAGATWPPRRFGWLD
jgi:hypothetical protein